MDTGERCCGRISAAIITSLPSSLKKALKVDYYYRDARFYLAEAYHAMGADEMAEAQLKLVIKQDEGDPETYLRLGEYYEVSKNVPPENRNDKVFAAYAKAVELGPERPDTPL